MSLSAQTVLKLKIFQARLGLFWEQCWQAVFWPMMIAGIVVLAVVSGGLSWLPFVLRIGLLVIAALAFLYSLKAFSDVSWPNKTFAIRRLETRSKLKHRPISTWDDALALQDENDQSPQSRTIWAAHQKRQAENIKNLKAGVPQSNWMYRDPNAWRFTLAGLLFVAVFFNGSNWRNELTKIASNGEAVVVKTVSLDAWISPPTFTKRAPILLTGLLTGARADRDGPEVKDIIVPEGSKLVVRLNGAKSGQIILSALKDGRAERSQAGAVLETIELLANEESDNQNSNQVTIQAGDQTGGLIIEKTIVLKRPVHVAIVLNGATKASWPIALIPDATPKIEILGNIRKTPTGGFGVAWLASDDYGVLAISGKLTLVKTAHKKSSSGKPLQYKPPVFSISLPSLNPKKAKGLAFQSLSDHPWAGQRVTLVLSVKDQGGQVGFSKAIEFELPQRGFVKPLAKALVEQRRNLVQRPDKKSNVVKMFAALMAWPDGLFEKSGVYLSLRVTASSLHQSRSDKELKAHVKDIWDLALIVEDGNASKALAKLDAIRKELQKALRDGASPKKIAELTAKLREALKNYMAAMERNIAQQMSKSQRAQNGLRQQRGREIRSRDLQKMMDKIEDLAKSGAKDAAQEMLSQLEKILKNLNPNQAQRRMAPQRTPPEAKALEELTDMLRQQRELMDQTFNMKDPNDPNAQNSQDQKDGQEQAQKRGGKNKDGKPSDRQSGQKGNQKLSAQQRELGKALGKILDQMAKNGLPAPKALDKARQAMREASKALKNGGKGSAMGYQGQAMQGLRKGAESMAKDLLNRGKGEQGNYGRHARENGPESNDPLGRPLPRNGNDFGPNKNVIPKESQILRAQDIMRTLRKRSNDRQRSKQELQYLDRLLDGLF